MQRVARLKQLTRRICHGLRPTALLYRCGALTQIAGIDDHKRPAKRRWPIRLPSGLDAFIAESPCTAIMLHTYTYKHLTCYLHDSFSPIVQKRLRRQCDKLLNRRRTIAQSGWGGSVIGPRAFVSLVLWYTAIACKIDEQLAINASFTCLSQRSPGNIPRSTGEQHDGLESG